MVKKTKNSNLFKGFLYMKKKYEDKIIIFIMILILLIPSTLAGAVDVVIEDSTPDLEAPLLKNITVSSNEANPNSSVKISAKVEDELSGVKNIRVIYQSNKYTSKYVYLSRDASNNNYEGIFDVGKYDDPGEWKIRYVYLEDNKENIRYVYDQADVNDENKFDFSATAINVSGVEERPVALEPTDKIAPVIESVKIDKNELSGPGLIKISSKITDEDSGVRTVIAYFKSKTGKSHYTYLYFNELTSYYEGTLSIDKYDEVGIYKLDSISANDNANNSINKNFNQSGVDLCSNKCTFLVSDITPDLVAPTLRNLGISLTKTSNNSANIKLAAEITDQLSGVNPYGVSLSYQKPSGKSIVLYLQESMEKGVFKGDISIDKYDELGQWKLKYVSFRDNKGNSRTVTNMLGNNSSDTWDFSPYYFTVIKGKITVPPSVPSSLTLSEYNFTMNPEESKQLNVKKNMTDDSSFDVTSGTQGTIYKSSDTSKVTVDGNGKISIKSGAAPGKVYITISNENLYVDCEITIPGAEKNNLLVASPKSFEISSGQSRKLSVLFESNDGTVIEVTDSSEISYESENPKNLNVTSKGEVFVPETSTMRENVTVNIEYKGLRTSVLVSILGPPKIRNLLVSPQNILLKYGESTQLNVRTLMSDGSNKDVTTSVIYTSLNSEKVTVDEMGYLSIKPDALSGEVKIKILYEGVETYVTVNIDGVPVVNKIKFNTSELSLTQGQTQKIKLSEVYSDESIVDITSTETGTMYTVSDLSRLSINTNGEVHIKENAIPGIVTVLAKNGGFKTTLKVSITKNISNDILSLQVEPNETTIEVGKEIAMKVLATMGDGTIRDVTKGEQGTTYTSSAPTRVTVDVDGRIRVLPDAVAGTVTVTAKNGIYTKSVTLTIVKNLATEVKGIVVNPGTSTLKTGDELSLEVLATMGDGAIRDVTQGEKGTTYTSSAPTRVTVDVDGRIRVLPDATAGTVTVTVKNDNCKGTFIIKIIK